LLSFRHVVVSTDQIAYTRVLLRFVSPRQARNSACAIQAVTR
jgi:hypothetical protein